MPNRLEVIAAGAVHSYFDELHNSAALADFDLHITFAPAGAITEKVRKGFACDVVISSTQSLHTLDRLGLIKPRSVACLGETEIAVCTRDGNPTPHIENEAALPALLLSATSIHIPDVSASTAGAHMAGIIVRLGLHDALVPKLHTHRNGNATMRAVADSVDPIPLGFTQRSEIISAPGTLLGDCLPGQLSLSTVYAAAITSHSRSTLKAYAFIEFLCSDEQMSIREIFGIGSNR
ncbi:MAG TPA: substrate-binding domain-containing protein [Xanthobacteraceae bacterium]|nr:substrate-binding domain-containing protein [Xanthobacteraceae bacterium]